MRPAGSSLQVVLRSAAADRRDGLLVVGRLVPPHQCGGQGHAWASLYTGVYIGVAACSLQGNPLRA